MGLISRVSSRTYRSGEIECESEKQMEREEKSNTSGYMAAIKPILKKLALGQIIALCIAVTGIVNEQITSVTRNNVNAPALTTISVYLQYPTFLKIINPGKPLTSNYSSST